ncbi:2044_t:CDS:1, partial [Ambispora leptoticha]
YTEIVLGCIILGGKNAFPVDFDTGKTIGHLKKAIKEQAELKIPAYKLKLWKVNVPQSRKHEIYEGIDVKVKFQGIELDDDLSRIEKYFPQGPPEEHIHIIVEPPSPATT